MRGDGGKREGGQMQTEGEGEEGLVNANWRETANWGGRELANMN